MSCLASCCGGCFSCCDNCKASDNSFQVKLKGAVQSVQVDKGDTWVTYRSANAAKLSAEDFMCNPIKQETMVHILKNTCSKNGDRQGMAWRRIDKVEVKELGGGKTAETYHMSERVGITYKKFWETVVAFANGLKALGVEPGRKIAIYEDTRYEWMATCYGIWLAGGTPVTVYANLGDDALVYALKESEVCTVVCNAKQVDKLSKLCTKSGASVRSIIFIDQMAGTPTTDSTKFKLAQWDTVVESGLNRAEPPNELTSDSLGLVMYTSGTTGDPKGVMLSQGNIVAAVNGLDSRLGDIFTDAVDPTYIAYLPLAHILEFAAENIMLMRGFTVCYSGPRTLSDRTTSPHGDLVEFKPTFFAGVPRVFDGLKKAVEERPKTEFQQAMFDRAVKERMEALGKMRTTPCWSGKVFSASSAALGGRCRWIISGGAPLSAKTQQWMTTVFDCYVGQGYGLTETGAACTVQNFWDYQTENVGGLLDICEVKLRDAAEIYKTSDNPPRGEVLIRSASVAQGYYKQPEKTAEAFLPDGFFATGDVGEMQPDGTLKIVGRTKALAKNALGEYIAMEALESVYVQNELVLPNGICVVVDVHQPFIVGVALTDETKVYKFCAANKIEGTYPAVLNTPAFIKAALTSLAKTAKDNGKKPFETFKNIRFYSDEWTPENGILTAAMKLKRREIDAKYKNDIEKMVADSAAGN